MRKITWIMIASMLVGLLAAIWLTVNLHQLRESNPAPITPSDISSLLPPIFIMSMLIYGVHISISVFLLIYKKNTSFFKATLFDKIVYWANLLSAFPFGLINALILHQKVSKNRAGNSASF